MALSLSGAWAQQATPRPLKKYSLSKSYTPPNTYRLLENSGIVYAQTDNMPILLAQSPDNMPNAEMKMPQDSGSVYRIPNPLRRQAKPQSQKP
ncbi:hypothetical protein [Runella slithyformis]|uniref:Uncharacterized protein n=1 Tax=Runella slithyformis (strain ATCC 29530 / DSM 19594 / LMG 11500 / NCIMB 11436 / LSU 4) TaxID=761193 RepID=A0A7U3ZI10_RUNSL|nr:hypothetical protein [Runella slithyformis]AEI47556.1 hypothetical protein Runsl_1127 [Runella slithyformis DSM 19594]